MRVKVCGLTRRIDVERIVQNPRPLGQVQEVFESFAAQTDTVKLVIDPSR